jgi:hypothetical protein
LLGPLDQDGAGLERLEVGCLLLGDAGENLDLGALEDVDDERGQSARGERKLDLPVLDPCGKDVLEEHENPELRSAPYVFMTDFVGWLPMDDSPGSPEAVVAADYNEENIRHIERYPYVRDAAVFIGSRDDIVPHHFGPDLPFMPDWIERHFDFSGYVLPFDPADFADTERIRRELGYDPTRPLIVASVGGSGVGIHLLRRIAAAFADLRKDAPETRLLLVCGPRIDPREIEPVEGMEVVGYVHDLFRILACCDLAVVQGGLTTTMELIAHRRPFIYIPLRNHFEQNRHVVHRLRGYGGP